MTWYALVTAGPALERDAQGTVTAWAPDQVRCTHCGATATLPLEEEPATCPGCGFDGVTAPAPAAATPTPKRRRARRVEA